MGPSCWGVFASALSLVFPKVLHFSFSVVFPPDLGWQQPPFQQRGSTAGPDRGSVKNQRSLTLKGCHRLPLWDFMGCHSPQRLVQHKHIFFSSPSDDLVPGRSEPATCPCHTPGWSVLCLAAIIYPQVGTVWTEQCEILWLKKCFMHIQNFCWSELTIANTRNIFYWDCEEFISNKHGMRYSIWKPQKEKDLPFKE